MASNYSTAGLGTRRNGLVKQASISSCAYVTFLAGDGDYWKGVVGLAKGLRKAQSKYPLVVAILPDVPEEHRKILVSQGCIVREIEPVHPPENQTQFAMAYYVINYSKLRIWEAMLRRPRFQHLEEKKGVRAKPRFQHPERKKRESTADQVYEVLSWMQMVF